MCQLSVTACEYEQLQTVCTLISVSCGGRYLQVLRLRAISTVCIFDVVYLQVLAADRRRAPLGRLRARRARARHGQLVEAQSARPRALPALAAGAQRVDERSVGRHRDCRSGERLVSFAVGTSVTYSTCTCSCTCSFSCLLVIIHGALCRASPHLHLLPSSPHQAPLRSAPS